MACSGNLYLMLRRIEQPVVRRLCFLQDVCALFHIVKGNAAVPVCLDRAFYLVSVIGGTAQREGNALDIFAVDTACFMQGQGTCRVQHDLCKVVVRERIYSCAKIGIRQRAGFVNVVVRVVEASFFSVIGIRCFHIQVRDNRLAAVHNVVRTIRFL